MIAADEASADPFRLLVDSVKDYAIFILDATGHVSTWNPGAARIKGYTADDIIGRHFSIFYPAEDVAAGKCELELEAAARDGRFEDEGWRLRKDGTPLWANVVITALRDASGKLVGFAKVTRDLTERRAAEERERALAAERASLAEKVRIQQFQERFLAILGHDLRNPLASIDIGAGLLQRMATDPAMLRVIERMRTSCTRMSRMITQILDLARTRLGGGLELTPEPVDLRDVLARVADELRLAHGARVIELRSPSLPGVWDRDRLEQVFSNLIGNALLYGDAGSPVHVVGRVEGDGIVVDVVNQGAPIPIDLQATLFDPFRRGERDSRTQKTAGLGLGLFISSEVVQAHGGTIAVRSSAAEGTRFRVALPTKSAPMTLNKAD
ncbi:MAG: PAS domain-containing sensor histidine kinase [Myxococcota bacterium]